jgi:hypothetical protein
VNSKGKVAPTLAASNVPKVTSVSGLGAGGGASLHCTDGVGGYVEVIVRPGSGFGASGNVVLTYPSSPPALSCAGDEQFGPMITGNLVGAVYTVSWTAANFPAPHPLGRPFRLWVEWASSQ